LLHPHCRRFYPPSRIAIFITAAAFIMTSIVELFPKCRKLAYDARQQVAQVQLGHMSVSDLQVVLEELQRQLTLMQDLVYKETPAQREVWQRKIQELQQDHANIQRQGREAAFNKANVYQKERDDLLRRRRNQNKGDETDLQNLAGESRSLESSHNMVLSLIDQGQTSLSGLFEQRQRLRGVKRVLVNIGNTLGLSQSTMRIIERRDVTDAYLVAAGMVVTLIVIYFVWF
jgi:golgi SNAP receptor complex member 2